jgi:hypothetical protein
VPDTESVNSSERNTVSGSLPSCPLETSSPLETASDVVDVPASEGRGRRPFPHRVAGALRRRDEGAATAEYAVATMAAVGFAGLLVVILRSEEVRAILTELVRNALTFTG